MSIPFLLPSRGCGCSSLCVSTACEEEPPSIHWGCSTELLQGRKGSVHRRDQVGRVIHVFQFLLHGALSYTITIVAAFNDMPHTVIKKVTACEAGYRSQGPTWLAVTLHCIQLLCVGPSVGKVSQSYSQ